MNTKYQKNTEALLMADKNIGLEFNVEKSRYTFMSYEQNAQNKIAV